MIETKSLPCPFCGQKPHGDIKHVIGSGGDVRFVLACTNETCSVQPRVMVIGKDSYVREKTIEVWNQRTPTKGERYTDPNLIKTSAALRGYGQNLLDTLYLYFSKESSDFEDVRSAMMAFSATLEESSVSAAEQAEPVRPAAWPSSEVNVARPASHDSDMEDME